MLAFTSIFAFSCTLQDHMLPAAPDVYVAGYEHTSSNQTARFWKNGKVTDLLSDTHGMTANSISASGGDVHVVGWAGDSNSIAVGKYWKNGVLQSFSGSYSPSFLSKVLVDGSNVYIAGTGVDQNGYYAMYWKNGVPVNLTNSRGGWARDIAIVNGDVYVTGEATATSGALATAKYWKNGVDVELSTGPEQHYPNGIAVANGDVHVVGTMSGLYRTVAKYWKNGVETILSPSSYHSNADDIAMLGNDVYIAGSVGDSLSFFKAQLWKNGVPMPLPGGVSASGITIVGNDIYVSGTGLNGVNAVAKYWKNGIPVDLSNGDINVIATSIFVTTP